MIHVGSRILMIDILTIWNMYIVIWMLLAVLIGEFLDRNTIFFSGSCSKVCCYAQCNSMHNQGGHTCPPGTPLGKSSMHMTQSEHYYEGSSDAVVESDVPTHTHAKNITHTQHSPTCCFLCIQGSQYYIVNNPGQQCPLLLYTRRTFLCSYKLCQ
jgi:hypothetical protein